MDQDFLQILNIMGGAAFAVRGQSVIWSSESARRLGVEPGMPLQPLLPEDLTPASLGEVRMLSLPALGGTVSAQVCPFGEMLVLVLRDTAPSLSYDSLGQINRILSSPVDEIMFTARTLFERLEELEDPAIQSGTARLTRNFFRLLRMSASLTDLQSGVRSQSFVPERTEIRRWLRTMGEKLESLVSAAGRRLELTLPQHHLYAQVDPALLEQAILSLLSNAIRYSPAGSTVALKAQEQNGQCLFTMRNPVAEPVSLTDLAGSFTRPVDALDRHGLGLGLLRVQNIARVHGGVLLLECMPTGDFSATLRVSCDRPAEELHASPVPVDRTGGYSRMLVELSDVLPDEVFDSRNL